MGRAMNRPATVLALNSGSSSLKFGVHAVNGDALQTLWSGEAQALGSATAQLRIDGQPAVALPDSNMNVVMRELEARMRQAHLPAVDVIGHRVVHGGPQLCQPCLIDDRVLVQLRAASAFAPLHTPAALQVMDIAREHFSGVAQVACFDTGLHADLPEAAQRLALPRALHAQGIRRYGFHGLSCESILHQLGDAVPQRLVIAHLGNGASVTALRGGRSVDTSMGLTPSGGLIMGTRSGDLDPGALMYLLRERGIGVEALEQMIDHQSGLLGISGLSSDLRELHAAAPQDPAAALAIEMFCLAARKQIAAMVAVLEGLDLLVFTGGIGENDSQVRQRICAGLQWVGLADKVRVLASQEDQQIARWAARLWAQAG
jgi:acetate kinase